MDHTLVKPNQLCAYGITVQDNPFSDDPIFTATEDHDSMLLLSYKRTILESTTIKPTEKELQTFPHVTCLLAHAWDPQNVCFPKSSRTAEEDISRNICAFMREAGSPYLTNTDSDSDSANQLYDIGAMTS